MEKNEEQYKKYVKMARQSFGDKNRNLDKIEELIDLAYLNNGGKLNLVLLNLYGRINLEKGNLQKAKYYYSVYESENEDDFPKVAYYGLFKVSVYEENYKEAKKYLSLYDSCFTDEFNMSFYLKCLNKMLELTGDKCHSKENYIEKEGYIGCFKAPSDVLRLYKKAEEFFDGGWYDLAFDCILNVQNLCAANNYKHDFRPLLKIIAKICIINKKASSNLKMKVEDLDYISNIEDKKRLLRAYINDSGSVKALITLVNILLNEQNYKEAYSLLLRKMDNKKLDEYVTELNLLRRKVYEAYNYENNKDFINDYLIRAQSFIDIKDYKNAFSLYNEGYEKLHSPVFLFKIAELNYVNKNMHAAKKYFIEYMNRGDRYAVECDIYLGYIKLFENKEQKAELKFESSLNYDDGKYFEVEKKAENGFFNAIKKEGIIQFPQMDDEFNNFCSNVIKSIKKGDIYIIERINKNRHDPLEIALIQIIAAPILLEKGAEYLSDKYYERSLIFSDDENISRLSEQYKKLRDSKKKNNN